MNDSEQRIQTEWTSYERKQEIRSRRIEEDKMEVTREA